MTSTCFGYRNGVLSKRLKRVASSKLVPQISSYSFLVMVDGSVATFKAEEERVLGADLIRQNAAALPRAEARIVPSASVREGIFVSWIFHNFYIAEDN